MHDKIIVKGIKFSIVPSRNEEDGLKLSFGIDKNFLYIKKYDHKTRSMSYIRYKLMKNCGPFVPWSNILPKHGKKAQMLIQNKWKNI